MEKLIYVYDNGELICVLSLREIDREIFTSARTEGNPRNAHEQKEHDSVAAFLERECCGSGSDYRFDVGVLTDEFVYDAGRTNALYFIVSAMKKAGFLRRLSESTAENLAPYIKAKGTAAEIITRRTVRDFRFYRTMNRVFDAFNCGIISADTAVRTMLVEAPSPRHAASMIHDTPIMRMIFIWLRAVSEAATDEKLRLRLRDYLAKLDEFIGTEND